MSSMVGPGVWIARWGPKGHLPHRGSDSGHVSNPCGFILHNATGAHRCYSWFYCHFQSRGSRGALKAVAGDGSLHRQAITSLKPGGGAAFCVASRGPGDDEDSLPCPLSLLALFCPLALSPPSPRTLAVRPPSWLTGDQRGLFGGSN